MKARYQEKIDKLQNRINLKKLNNVDTSKDEMDLITVAMSGLCDPDDEVTDSIMRFKGKQEEAKVEYKKLLSEQISDLSPIPQAAGLQLIGLLRELASAKDSYKNDMIDQAWFHLSDITNALYNPNDVPADISTALDEDCDITSNNWQNLFLEQLSMFKGAFVDGLDRHKLRSLSENIDVLIFTRQDF